MQRNYQCNQDDLEYAPLKGRVFEKDGSRNTSFVLKERSRNFKNPTDTPLSFLSACKLVRLTAAFPTPYATLKRYVIPPDDETLTISPCLAGTIILAACHAAM